MRKLQLADTVIGPILQAKEKDQKPSPDEVKVQPCSTSRLVQQWDQLEVKGGVLWRVIENGGGNEVRQLIVPQSSLMNSSAGIPRLNSYILIKELNLNPTSVLKFAGF